VKLYSNVVSTKFTEKDGSKSNWKDYLREENMFLDMNIMKTRCGFIYIR